MQGVEISLLCDICSQRDQHRVGQKAAKRGTDKKSRNGEFRRLGGSQMRKQAR